MKDHPPTHATLPDPSQAHDTATFDDHEQPDLHHGHISDPWPPILTITNLPPNAPEATCTPSKAVAAPRSAVHGPHESPLQSHTMSGTLKPPGPNEADNDQEYEYKEQDDVPALSRSPHPYHRQSWELLDPTDHTATRATSIPTHKHEEDIHDHLLPKPSFTKDSTPVTDSGTEADDEIFVKKLPAPRAKLHKGLRSRHEAASGVWTPLLTPSTADGDPDVTLSPTKGRREESEKRHQATSLRRNRVLVRRGAEVLILALLAWTVARNPTVRPLIASWKRGEFPHTITYYAILLRHSQSRCFRPHSSWCCCRSTPCELLRGLTRGVSAREL